MVETMTVVVRLDEPTQKLLEEIASHSRATRWIAVSILKKIGELQMANDTVDSALATLTKLAQGEDVAIAQLQPAVTALGVKVQADFAALQAQLSSGTTLTDAQQAALNALEASLQSHTETSTAVVGALADSGAIEGTSTVSIPAGTVTVPPSADPTGGTDASASAGTSASGSTTSTL